MRLRQRGEDRYVTKIRGQQYEVTKRRTVRRVFIWEVTRGGLGPHAIGATLVSAHPTLGEARDRLEAIERAGRP